MGVVGETEARVTLCFPLRAAKQRAETDGWLAQASLGQTERAHADAHNPARPRMARRLCGRCRSCKEEPARGRVSIDCYAYGVPNRRHMLPLIQQDRRRICEQHRRVRTRNGPDLGHIKAMHRGRAAFGRRSLAHRLGALDCDGGEFWEKLIELVIDDPLRVIAHG